ncbi:MAG TPA: ABC transporter permease [Acidobacteriota bacterium]|nr:ABC transporter permease [Acidobacteriota bacterium]
MLRDLRHALRLLLQNKGWTAVLLLSLALGIGVNTALFSAVNGLLLRTLAVPQPQELVRLLSAGDNDMVQSTSIYGYVEENAAGESVRPSFSYQAYLDMKEANETLTGLTASAPIGRVNVIVDGNAELASAFLVTGNFFQTLGVPAFAGRTLNPEDDQEGASPVALISHGYWERRFGSDRAALGKSVTVNGVPVTIVGVTPPGYTGIQRLGSQVSDLHLPLFLDTQLNNRPRLDRPTYWWLQLVGRMKPGVTPQQVEGNLEGVFQASAKAGWDSHYAALSEEQKGLERNRDRAAVPSLEVASAARGVYDPNPSSVGSITTLSVVVILVLLIVCANVANLLLSRVTARHKEISVRLSMGAGRGRLIRQLLTESVLLGALGGILALVVAYWTRDLLPFGSPPPLDWRVFAFAAGISILTGLIFGIIPALRATRVDLAVALNESGRSQMRSRSWLAKSLLILQVAVSLVLLVGAGLFLRTLYNLQTAPVGFDKENLLLVSVNPRVNRYDDERSQQIVDQLKDEFGSIAGVSSVSVSQTALLSGSTWSSSVHPEGNEREDLNAHMMTVSPEFLDTMKIPLLAGRNFTPQDTEGAPEVALINEAAVREFYPDGGSPLGRRFGHSPEERSSIEVVGVVQDAKYSSVRDEAPPTVYRSYLQRSLFTATFELRTAIAPRSIIPSVRQAARRVDPTLPLSDVSTQAEEVEERFSQERTFALAYSLFGGLALLLACIGLFGLMSYSVTQRTNEMGIRLALGAQRTDVIRMILRESLIMVGIGLTLGLGTALAAGRLIDSLLYNLAPNDPVTIALAAVLMVLVATLAGYLPARRASRVNPITALHFE